MQKWCEYDDFLETQGKGHFCYVFVQLYENSEASAGDGSVTLTAANWFIFVRKIEFFFN